MADDETNEEAADLGTLIAEVATPATTQPARLSDAVRAVRKLHEEVTEVGNGTRPPLEPVSRKDGAFWSVDMVPGGEKSGPDKG
jgi:hypothetical protein